MLCPILGAQPSPRFRDALTLGPLAPYRAPCPTHPKGPSERVRYFPLSPPRNHKCFCTAKEGRESRGARGEWGVGMSEGPAEHSTVTGEKAWKGVKSGWWTT